MRIDNKPRTFRKFKFFVSYIIPSYTHIFLSDRTMLKQLAIDEIVHHLPPPSSMKIPFRLCAQQSLWIGILCNYEVLYYELIDIQCFEKYREKQNHCVWNMCAFFPLTHRRIMGTTNHDWAHCVGVKISNKTLYNLIKLKLKPNFV